MRLHPVIGRASYYVFAGGLAIMFLIPLVWTVVASVSPHGAGFGITRRPDSSSSDA